MGIAAIIPARGGSKGIPGKNIKDFCGKPLLAWSILQAKKSPQISSVWVSSDDEGILNVARQFGAGAILRPAELAGDKATSESAWLHAVDTLEASGGPCEAVVGMQCTSPLRETGDIERGLSLFREGNLDSMFSGALIGDFYIWQRGKSGELESFNYDWKSRKRRQEISEQYVENGSFYIFRPDLLRRTGNRLGGNIGVVPMEFWKSFELDTLENWKMCEFLMRGFGLDKAA